MSSLRHPVGPQPPSVYWRRRLLVGLGLLAVVVVIVLIVVRPGSGEPAAAPTDSGSSAPADDPTGSVPDPGASTPPGDVAACDPEVLRLEPVTDASSYGNGIDPMISMEITNAGAGPCSYDVGTGSQEYVITSGADRIWSSADCQVEPTEAVIVLEPDETLATTPFAWDRTRSTPDTCEGERPEVIAGGASYHLSVVLGEAESADTKQFLLD